MMPSATMRMMIQHVAGLRRWDRSALTSCSVPCQPPPAELASRSRPVPFQSILSPFPCCPHPAVARLPVACQPILCPTINPRSASRSHARSTFLLDSQFHQSAMVPRVIALQPNKNVCKRAQGTSTHAYTHFCLCRPQQQRTFDGRCGVECLPVTQTLGYANSGLRTLWASAHCSVKSACHTASVMVHGRIAHLTPPTPPPLLDGLRRSCGCARNLLRTTISLVGTLAVFSAAFSML